MEGVLYGIEETLLIKGVQRRKSGALYEKVVSVFETGASKPAPWLVMVLQTI